MSRREVTYYCAFCFENNEEVSKVTVFTGKEKNLYECESCTRRCEDDEILNKKDIMETLDENIEELEQQELDAKEEYLAAIKEIKEDISRLDDMKKELR